MPRSSIGFRIRDFQSLEMGSIPIRGTKFCILSSTGQSKYLICINTYMKSVCKYCKEEFDLSNRVKGWMANHSRWCSANPKRKDYINATNKSIAAMTASKQRSGNLNQYVKNPELKMSEITKKKISIKKTGNKHTEESKQKISLSARKSKHRRLRKNVIKYETKSGQIVLLDSRWEFALAKRLDEINVSWIRPDPIEWLDKDGKTRNYFPDFYLPDFDLYLDPKNKHAYEVQKDKIKILLTQLPNLVIITDIKDCENFCPRIIPAF